MLKNKISLKKTVRNVINKSKKNKFITRIGKYHTIESVIKYNKKYPYAKMALPFIVAILIFTGVDVTTTQAYEVKVNGETVAIVDDVEVYTEAKKEAETVVDEVKPESTNEVKDADVSVSTVVTTRNESFDNQESVVTEIVENTTDVEKQYVLYIDDNPIGFASSKEELEKILDDVAKQYYNEFTTEHSFGKDVRIEEEFIDTSKTEQLDVIVDKVNSLEEIEFTYIVKEGDTYYDIATAYELTVDELYELNPEIDKDILSIDTELKLTKETPFLPVITKGEETYEAVIDSPIQYIDDDTMYIGEEEVTIEGDDGLSSNVADVTYINGVEEIRDIKETTVLKEATQTQITRGTMEKPKTASTGTYIYPANGTFTSGYGYRYLLGIYQFHYGIDIAAAVGTEIYASDGGEVIFSGWKDGYGNTIIIEHDNGVKTLYAHNSLNAVSVGQKVYQGQYIADMGSTGYSTGSHIHFEIQVNGNAVDPLTYLQ